MTPAFPAGPCNLHPFPQDHQERLSEKGMEELPAPGQSRGDYSVLPPEALLAEPPAGNRPPRSPHLLAPELPWEGGLALPPVVSQICDSVSSVVYSSSGPSPPPPGPGESCGPCGRDAVVPSRVDRPGMTRATV